MSEVKSNKKDTTKKLKELKIDEKKHPNVIIKKPAGISNIIIPSNILKVISKDSKNSTHEKLKAGDNIGKNEKVNLTSRDKTEINKQISSENKSFSENDISEHDDEWRNLNELVFKFNFSLTNKI